MICTCKNCRYTFEAPLLPSACPDCGKKIIKGRPAVRPATVEETRWYRNMQEELKREAS